jgi:alpha-L-fucosidase
MNRRTFHRTLAGALACASVRAAPAKNYEATWESIRTHTVPDWYDDAKLGIFIHWGLYSVPAWAPPSGELGKVDPSRWFYENPYAEWYSIFQSTNEPEIKN